MDLLGIVSELQFHHDRVLAWSVIILSQTPFFKFEFAIKTARRKICPPHLQRRHRRLFGHRFSDRFLHHPLRDALPPMPRMNRNVQDMALVSDQPSTEVAAQRRPRGRSGERGQRQRKRQRQLADERIETPRMVKGKLLNLEYRGQVARRRRLNRQRRRMAARVTRSLTGNRHVCFQAGGSGAIAAARQPRRESSDWPVGLSSEASAARPAKFDKRHGSRRNPRDQC